jgi:hypothetical protein
MIRKVGEVHLRVQRCQDLIFGKFPEELINGALSLVGQGRLYCPIDLIRESCGLVLLILVAYGLQAAVGISLNGEGIVEFLIFFTHLLLPAVVL